MDAAYGFPVFHENEIHAGADDVGEGCACLGECFFGDGEDAAGLAGDALILCSNWAGAG